MENLKFALDKGTLFTGRKRSFNQERHNWFSGHSLLRSLCNEYQEKICQIESDKYDLEKEVEFKDYQINELNIAVNDLRGKL